MVKVVGFSEELNKDELIKGLKDNNSVISKDFSIRVVAIKKMKHRYLAILELDERKFDATMNEGVLFISMDVCTVFEHYDLLRCFNCSGFHHTAKNCTKKGRIRHDVESRKVCFLCLKTRFGIFGPWGRRCALCRRTVCARCCRRASVPPEQFAAVPVALLSPSVLGTPDGEEPGRRTPLGGGAATPVGGSKTPVDGASPADSRPGSAMDSSTTFRSKATAVGRAARAVDRMKGAPQMVVCHDCRLMVLQIIESARASRAAVRNKTIQNLTLNLSPVF
ncbi:unnamed protein product [Callosobruchus maculatus]|uniref:CCHC-type domain-containing protein n=1 Tax=Callosobruchus maculatus TaxID=64391 RepID=A0A653C0E1_CALMS|nr:unnamed protein product [Callosobruchus maculatus]